MLVRPVMKEFWPRISSFSRHQGIASPPPLRSIRSVVLQRRGNVHRLFWMLVQCSLCSTLVTFALFESFGSHLFLYRNACALTLSHATESGVVKLELTLHSRLQKRDFQ